MQITKILIMQYAPVPRYFGPRRSKYLPQHPILNILNSGTSLNVTHQVTYPCKIIRKIIIVCTLIFSYLVGQSVSDTGRPGQK